MSHWEVVWVCFGLTVVVLLLDFLQAGHAARRLREQLLLADEANDPESGQAVSDGVTAKTGLNPGQGTQSNRLQH